ncbi:MAG TPA: hypothetical protein VGN57_07820 [Pirellulaceae bacterium]|jgi:hypothetical protein|nr:hypothetical protein [Pirellulaceae bacterium]
MTIRSRFSRSMLGVLSLGCCAPALAYFPPLWPPEIHIGKVRVGSQIEGTIRAHLDDVDRAGSVEATPPEGMIIDGIAVQSTYMLSGGAKTPQTVASVSFTVDTSEAGAREGVLKFRVGKESREIPFSVNVVPPSEGAIRTLVLFPPVSEGSQTVEVYRPWTDMVEAGNFDVTYLDPRPRRSSLAKVDFASYDVAVLSPVGMSLGWNEAESAALKAFLEKGGRAVLFTTGRFSPGAKSVETLLDSAGIDIEQGSPFGPGEGLIGEAHIAGDPLTEGVRNLAMGNPNLIAISDPAKARLLVLHPQDGTKGFVAVAKVGEGELIVVSESSPWFWIGNPGPRSLDNPRLMQNFMTLGLPRQKKAADATTPQGADPTP